MISISRFFFEPGDPDRKYVFPEDSPWYWRWGWPGIKSIYRFRRYEAVFNSNEGNTLSQDVINAEEKFKSARFSCLYGREGSRQLRRLATEIEKNRIASRGELQRIIRSGDLRSKKSNGEIIMRPSWIAAVCGALFLMFNMTALTVLNFHILSMEGTTDRKVFAIFIISTFYLYNMWEFNNVTLRPFLIARRLAPKLIRLLQESRRNAPAFLLYRNRPE